MSESKSITKNYCFMIFREAKTEDIDQIQVVRNSVRENMLSNPNLVTNEDCEVFINQRGRGWVCEIKGKIVGFAIADLINENIWALFIHPAFEGRGIGKRLHQMMLDWYFDQNKVYVWLGTAPHTRAEQFYRRRGWTEAGTNGEKEIKFEMSIEDWNLQKAGLL